MVPETQVEQEVVTPDITPDDGGQEPKIESGAPFKAITSQEDFDAAISKRIARERSKYEGYDEFKAKAEEFEKLEAEKGSDLEKLTRQVEKANRERDELKSKVAKAERLDLVRDIAEELGLPKKLVNRVQGDSEDDIRADIADLMDGLPSPKKGDDSKKEDAPNGAPPSRSPKPKTTFSATGDESDEGLDMSADDILKQLPRGGGVR